MPSINILNLPKLTGTEELKVSHSVVIVGANGSGKSRLGSWIESNSSQPDKVYRISAQKSLTMPDSTTPMALDKAEKGLWFGYPDVQQGQEIMYRNGQRWNNNPITYLLSDFDKLMIYLFSEKVEENEAYSQKAKLTTERVEPPDTKLDKVKTAWETVLPHRELILGGLQIQTKTRGDAPATYNSSEMSDGERVIFYLIGQCLAAPPDGIIVIDEPEIHLHKSVQSPLWSEIEKLRSDCLFIYLTHDVNFAAAQVSAEKIWLKSYDGSTWDWERIEDIEGLPEALLIEILGSRKHIVFVEGENGSFDSELYRLIFPKFFVIPMGSCTKVIESVKALQTNNQLHHLDIYGIVDRDRRVDEEIDALLTYKIYTLEVAEVENLFCTQEVLALVSSKLARNVDEDFTNAANLVFKRLKEELETQISLHSASEIKFRLNLFGTKVKGQDNLNAELSRLIKDIDVSSIYQDKQQLFENIISSSDYNKLLKYYNRKSIASQISAILGLKDGELAEFVIRLARGNTLPELKSCLASYFNNFPDIA